MKLLEQLNDEAKIIERQKNSSNKEIMLWIKKYLLPANMCMEEHYDINEDNSVNFKVEKIALSRYEYPVIGINIRDVRNFTIESCPNLRTLVGSPQNCVNMNVYQTPITDLVGMPHVVSNNLMLQNNIQLVSTQGGPCIIGNKVDFINCAKLSTLHNIHKHFQTASSILIGRPRQYKSNVLGLLLIKSLDYITTELGSPRMKWVEIINNHLRTDRDVLACQDQLIEEGFEELARI